MKIIKFYSDDPAMSLGGPVPAKKMIPEWYRKAESSFIEEGQELAGLKKCMPFMDTMVSGYFLTFPVNVYVNEKEGSKDSVSKLFNNTDTELTLRWDGPDTFSNFISERPKTLGSTMPRPPGHYPNHLIFTGSWSIKTPRGWSVLMMPPLNRHDLPFTASSGIIDSDKFISSGNIPFFMKRGFSGVIEAGTPFVQLIPIKRAEWAMSTNDPSLRDQSVRESFEIQEKETAYKRKSWIRKKYD